MKVLSTGLKDDELLVQVGLRTVDLERLLNRGLLMSYDGDCGRCGNCGKCNDCGRCTCFSDQSEVARPAERLTKGRG